MRTLNKREIAILEDYDFNVNNVEELETWTNGGVNMFVLYQEHHKDVLEAFKDTLYFFDIDEEIDLYRQGIDYCNNFTIRESLEDFEDYKERLKNIVTALEISAELDNFDVCTSEWASDVRKGILAEESEQYSGYYTMLVEDMSIDDLDLIKDFDEVYTYDNKVLGLRHIKGVMTMRLVELYIVLDSITTRYEFDLVFKNYKNELDYIDKDYIEIYENGDMSDNIMEDIDVIKEDLLNILLDDIVERNGISSITAIIESTINFTEMLNEKEQEQ